MGLLVSSEHCIASPKLAPVASLVSAPAIALSFIHTISTTYRFGPCGVVGDALALWLPRSVPAISSSATKTELFRARDRWFESISLLRRVYKLSVPLLSRGPSGPRLADELEALARREAARGGCSFRSRPPAGSVAAGSSTNSAALRVRLTHRWNKPNRTVSTA